MMDFNEDYFRYLEENAETILRGYKCRICGREITHNNRENNRGDGFMKISMISHLKKHWRESRKA